MRLAIEGENGAIGRLEEALGSIQMAVERLPAVSVPAEGEAAQIAAAMRVFDEWLTVDSPDGLLLTSASNRALAALLVATKVRLPVACLEGGGEGQAGGRADINAILIRQLADTTLAEDAEAIAAWVRST